MLAVINSVCRDSTGKIAVGLQRYLLEHGHNAVVCYGRKPDPDTPHYRIDHKLENCLHYAEQRLTGQMCCGSRQATKRLVKYLKANNCDGVFLVNVHGSYCNEKILFDYLVENNIRVVYIMADESAVWGNCFYKPDGCTRYEQQCVGCPMLKSWQRLLFGERAQRAFAIKKNAYPKLRAAFVAPEFVINGAKMSPLMKGLRTEIVDEAIDVMTAQPRDTSILRNKLGISEEKIVIVCVAPNDPGHRNKGVHFFIEAARRLEKDNRFQFVHVGWRAGKKTGLPSNYIAIDYVRNQEELSYYYSLGDLFVFPSLRDSMSNACLDALACGTPLLCFNTSGMPFLGDDSVLTLVEPESVDQLVDAISRTKKKTQEQIETCRNYALKRYDSRKYFERLMAIMDSINKSGDVYDPL